MGDDRHDEAEDSIRERAELQARRMWADDPADLPAEESQRLVHELRVHQIELEMQNDELRRAHLALDVARLRYFDLYDLAPVGYVTLGEGDAILEANLAASELLGAPRTSLIDQPLTAFVAPEDQDTHYRRQRALAKTGERQVYELRVKHGDGTVLWVQVDATEARDDEEGGARTHRATLTDVTDAHWRQADEAQRDRMATMGILAAGVAHEINNPLTYVLYHVDTLAVDLPLLARAVGRWREALGDLVGGERVAEIGGEASPLGEQVRLAEMIESATAAASGLHQIKEIAQGLSHLARVEHEPCSRVDLNVAAEAALKMVSQEIALRAISVVDLSPVPAIVASGSAVAQVLLNLLLNAAHSIEKGTRDENRVTLRTWAADGYVFAEVTDTGCGIPPEDQAAIFEPFFTTRGPKRGTGLGLAVSHRIVSDCGGDIEVRSDVGAGSRFLVRFPVAPTETAVPDPVVADGLEVRGRILLVDDDPFVRRAVTKMLARHHDIVAARSGREAMELLATDADFGLVLCDLMMVDVAGIDVHAWLALHHPALARRVVFITGGVFTPGTGGYLDAHPEIVCLQKPFDMKGLRRLVQERLVALSRA